ncbi:MAG: HlyD family secretion protein [Verrucomicrobia bacterium]|nr:HlyD family secretion protein [Verrucomicrobiota bacterium]
MESRSPQPEAVPTNAPTASRRPAGRRRLLGPWLVGLLAAALGYVGSRYLAETLTHESTDDAFIEGHVVLIAPKVAGQVQAVHVVDNQPVRQGDLLVEIDPRDYDAALDQKQSALARAKANQSLIEAGFVLLRTRIATAQASADQAQADLLGAKATADRAQADFDRAKRLPQPSVISPQDFDAAKAAALAAAAGSRSAQDKVRSEGSKVQEAQAQLTAAESAYDLAKAEVQQARAELQTGELNLSYTKITAPSDGRVTRRSVEPGGYVQVGQSLMALVPTNLYVVANFKETELTDMRPGQPATLVIESYPARVFRGHVESIQAGSGARFSLLPPENAVGNYVKVVQRVPVKIVFDEPLPPDRVVGPGMSVVPEVTVQTWRMPGWSFEVIGLLAGVLAAIVARRIWNRPGTKPPSPAPQ